MVLFLVACTGGGSTSSKTPPTGDTGGVVDTGIPPEDACAPDVGAIQEVACAESDAALGTSPYSSYGPIDLTFTATVTEIGGVLAKVPDSAGVGAFRACGADHLHQVRLVDDAGASWTLGWDLDGSVDDASTDAISVDEELTVEVFTWFWGYGTNFAFRLSDATGPVVFYESFAYDVPLTDEARGGISAEVEDDEGCVARDPEWDRVLYRPVTFTGPYGTTELVSGQTAPVTLTDRAVTLTLAGSERNLGCADGCSGTTWTGWETP